MKVFAREKCTFAYIDEHLCTGFKMEEFTVLRDSDLNLQNKLADAFRGNKLFRRFKDVLLNSHKHREKWFEFQSQNLSEFIKDWALSEQLELDFEKDG